MDWLTTLVELLGGFALMANLAVVLIRVLLIIVNPEAMFSVHRLHECKSIKLRGVAESGAGQCGRPDTGSLSCVSPA